MRTERSWRSCTARPCVVFVAAILWQSMLPLSTPRLAQADQSVGLPTGRISPSRTSSPGPPFRSEVTPLPPVEPCGRVEPCGCVEPCEYIGPCDNSDSPAVPVVPRREPSLLDQCEIGLLARGYYLNDQRIEWTGLECTLGAEAVVTPVFRHCWNGWLTTLEGEFYVNQPFDRNILVDTPERASYAGNFDVDSLEISQLFLSFQRGDLLLSAGKMETPFGRTHFPIFSNARLDAPFIRTEAILWRETGVLVRYEPGMLVAEAALTNGSEDRDTNSSKALVARVGIESNHWGLGASCKFQDGIGSESQKQFNNHLGIDFVTRRGPWTLSGEAIYDEYGFRRPGFDPLDITWGRSIYFRDQNLSFHEPIHGVGYYLNLGYCGRCWELCLNYGEYYPQSLGDPQHDRPNRRGIVKLDYRIGPCVEAYTVVIAETNGFVAQDDRPRRGSVVLIGLQWSH